MADQVQWAFPSELQPKAGEVGFDLAVALDAVVGLRAAIPDDAFTASILGTERSGNGVVIDADGLVLTIGYLITEAEPVWLTANSGAVVPAHALAYDHVTGLGLVQPLARLGVAPLPRCLWTMRSSTTTSMSSAAAVAVTRCARESSRAVNSRATGSTCSTRRCSRHPLIRNGAAQRCSTQAAGWSASGRF